MPIDTALIKASSEGHCDVVRELLKHKDVDVHAINHDGKISLILAVEASREGYCFAVMSFVSCCQ